MNPTTSPMLRAAAHGILFADLGTPLRCFVIHSQDSDITVDVVELGGIPRALGGRPEDDVAELLAWRAEAPYVARLPRVMLDPGDGSGPVVAVPSVFLVNVACDLVEAHEDGSLPEALRRYAAGAQRILDAMAAKGAEATAARRGRMN